MGADLALQKSGRSVMILPVAYLTLSHFDAEARKINNKNSFANTCIQTAVQATHRSLLHCVCLAWCTLTN